MVNYFIFGFGLVVTLIVGFGLTTMIIIHNRVIERESAASAAAARSVPVKGASAGDKSS
ncbi:MAG: hypothetical protein ACI9SE_002331 [Neolewinella sp.]|jgi:hypothetical protein